MPKTTINFRHELNDSSVFSFGKFNVNKRTLKSLVCILFFALFFSSGLFAADGIAVLDSTGTKILELVSAVWVKALLVVALIIEFGVIAFGSAQGEGGIIKKVLPWIIGTAGILGATSIVNFFFKSVTPEALAYVKETVKIFAV